MRRIIINDDAMVVGWSGRSSGVVTRGGEIPADGKFLLLA